MNGLTGHPSTGSGRAVKPYFSVFKKLMSPCLTPNALRSGVNNFYTHLTHPFAFTSEGLPHDRKIAAKRTKNAVLPLTNNIKSILSIQ